MSYRLPKEGVKASAPLADNSPCRKCIDNARTEGLGGPCDEFCDELKQWIKETMVVVEEDDGYCD